MRKPLLGFILILALVGCKSTAESYLKKNDAAFNLKVEATACFGTCPIYTMQINNAGDVTYNGKRFVEKEGEVSKVIPLWEVDSLKLILTENDFFSLDTIYDANVSDLPSFIVDFTSEDEKSKYHHKVIGRHNYPEHFNNIKAFLERLRKRNFD